MIQSLNNIHILLVVGTLRGGGGDNNPGFRNITKFWLRIFFVGRVLKDTKLNCQTSKFSEGKFERVMVQKVWFYGF